MSAEPRPTFSVLIATYNHARYVVEALETVAEQEFGDYEIVVVNDGSTDETETVVEGWLRGLRERSGVRAVLSTTPNQGQSAAFEHGFGLCRGRYIALLDSDDRWLPAKLQRVAAAAAADPGAGMIVHPLIVIDAEGRRTGDVRPMGARLSGGDLSEQMRRTTRHVPPATSGIVIRADVFAGLLPMPTKGYRADADAYLTFGASLAAPVRVVPEPLGEYRMHPEGHYIWRVTTEEGLDTFVGFQRIIARHFGLEPALRRNSYFMRHDFALRRLRGESAAAAARDLLGATLRDDAFSPARRVALAGFWGVCALAPRPVFQRLWNAFQRRHTGHDRVAPSNPAAR